MSSKPRNMLLVAFVFVILAAPCGSMLFQKLSPSFAAFSSLEQQKADYLIGGKQAGEPLEECLTLDDFVHGTLQTSIENTLGEVAPCRYSALLSYSASQRAFIETSNHLFNFEVYPTRYSADKLYSPTSDALSGMPFHYSSKQLDELSWMSGELAKLATDYPEKHFCVIVADISNTSSIQPSFYLENGTFSSTEAAKLLKRACKEVPNITVFANSYDNLSSYYAHYYTTDHHWNGWGALSAYEQAIQLIGSEQKTEASSLEIRNEWEKAKGLDWLVINGSNSRAGLMLLNEPMNEPEIPLENVKVTSNISPNGESAPSPMLITPNKVEEMKQGLALEFDFYETWYGANTATTTINESSGANQDALIIGDSFASAFKWIAATQFNKVTSLPSLRGDTQQAAPIREIIDSTNSDYVFFVAGAHNYIKTAEKFPNYFD